MRMAEDWTPADSGITTKIPPLTAEGVAAYKKLMENWNGDGNSCSKFSSIYGGLYKVFIRAYVYTCICAYVLTFKVQSLKFNV
jgi:hypothetical protein